MAHLRRRIVVTILTAAVVAALGLVAPAERSGPLAAVGGRRG